MGIKDNAQGTGGDIGGLSNGAIIAKFVDLQPGMYQGWFTIAYIPNPNGGGAAPTVVISPVFTFTVN